MYLCAMVTTTSPRLIHGIVKVINRDQLRIWSVLNSKHPLSSNPLSSFLLHEGSSISRFYLNWVSGFFSISFIAYFLLYKASMFFLKVEYNRSSSGRDSFFPFRGRHDMAATGMVKPFSFAVTAFFAFKNSATWCFILIECPLCAIVSPALACATVFPNSKIH